MSLLIKAVMRMFFGAGFAAMLEELYPSKISTLVSGRKGDGEEGSGIELVESVWGLDSVGCSCVISEAIGREDRTEVRGRGPKDDVCRSLGVSGAALMGRAETK